MIDLAVLGLLEEQDLHGYELRKRLAELPGGRSTISFGSLYPALNRLERGGMVKAVEASTRTDRRAPSGGSLGGGPAAVQTPHPPPSGGRRQKGFRLPPPRGGAARRPLTGPPPAGEAN